MNEKQAIELVQKHCEYAKVWNLLLENEDKKAAQQVIEATELVLDLAKKQVNS